MLLKKGLILDKVATPVIQILATYKKIGYSSHNNKLLHKCIRKKFHCTMVATPTINRLQKMLRKRYSTYKNSIDVFCLNGCNFRYRVIATSVIRWLLTMNQSKPCVLTRLQLLRDYSCNSCN
jgi:hypothetical protein